MDDKTKYVQLINDLNNIVYYLKNAKNNLLSVKTSSNNNFSTDGYGYYNDEIDNIIYKINSYINYIKYTIIPYCKNKKNEL